MVSSRCPRSAGGFRLRRLAQSYISSHLCGGSARGGSRLRVVPFLEQNVVLRDRCRRSDGFGGSKRGFV